MNYPFDGTIKTRKIEKWSIAEFITEIFYIIVEKSGLIRIAPDYFHNLRHKYFRKKYLRQDKNGNKYFNFKGIKLAYVERYDETRTLHFVFQDTLAFHTLYNDDYNSRLVKKLDLLMNEGPFGYTDKEKGIDVTVKSKDIVIDAGAWLGDFAAYAAFKGATVYAFEPTDDVYNMLLKTIDLNKEVSGKIIPVKLGLGDTEEELKIGIKRSSISGSNSFIDDLSMSSYETAHITTVDSFVNQHKLERVDFIKSDIEGFERNLLTGAKETLKRFAPKLAICTYHLPDDPETLEKIIKEANPNYTVIQLKHKLIATVVK